jgi:hypothetical protein
MFPLPLGKGECKGPSDHALALTPALSPPRREGVWPVMAQSTSCIAARRAQALRCHTHKHILRTARDAILHGPRKSLASRHETEDGRGQSPLAVHFVSVCDSSLKFRVSCLRLFCFDSLLTPAHPRRWDAGFIGKPIGICRHQSDAQVPPNRQLWSLLSGG